MRKCKNGDACRGMRKGKARLRRHLNRRCRAWDRKMIAEGAEQKQEHDELAQATRRAMYEFKRSGMLEPLVLALIRRAMWNC